MSELLKARTVDERLLSLELKISIFLRYGALTAGAVLLTGWMIRLAQGRSALAGFTEHRPVPMTESLRAAWASGDVGLLVGYAGLCILISLPILRVALVAALFARGKERALAAAAAFVLAALALSFVLGFEI